MKIKKLLAVLLAALFVAGLLPLGGITLPAAKAETTVDWPQITEFTFNNFNWPTSATFDDGVTGAALTGATITQYTELVPQTEGSTTQFYAGEMVIYVDGFSNNEENASIRNRAANNEAWSITIEWNGAEGTKTPVVNVIFSPDKDYVNDSGLYLKRDGVTYYYKVKLRYRHAQPYFRRAHGRGQRNHNVFLHRRRNRVFLCRGG